MVTVDDVINEINSYIKTIIQDIVTFRTKRIEASQKVLDKIKSIMDMVSYAYRLGDLYDKAIKVEKTGMIHYDIKRPRLKVNYTGPKTTLYYDTNYIEVPSVPVFIYEPYRPDYISHETGVEAVRKNIAVKLPPITNVVETPDIENAYGKYFQMEYYGYSHQYLDWTIFSGKKIAWEGIVLEIDVIRTFLEYKYRRLLTIDGTQYLFYLNANFGRLSGSVYFDPTASMTGIEYPCTLFEYGTNYGGDSSIILFGNEYTRGELQGDIYGRDILMLFVGGRAITFQL